MMKMFDAEEDVRIAKPDGRVLGPHRALFAGHTIFINDPMADLEEGDEILRKLPNGKDERSMVTSATFFNEGIGPLGPHYQVKFRKGSRASNTKLSPQINITGAQSVQIGDHNSQNIIGSFEALVKQIESSSASPGEKAEAKSLLKSFLNHPLVVSLLGAIAGAVVK